MRGGGTLARRTRIDNRQCRSFAQKRLAIELADERDRQRLLNPAISSRMIRCTNSGLLVWLAANGLTTMAD